MTFLPKTYWKKGVSTFLGGLGLKRNPHLDSRPLARFRMNLELNFMFAAARQPW